MEGLTFTQVENRLVAQVAATEGERSPLSYAAMREMIGEAGYGSWMLLNDEVITLVERWQSIPTDFEMPVAEKRDASVQVHLAEDNSVAWISVTPAQGGKPLMRMDVIRALGAVGVTYGIDNAAVLQACKATAPLKITVARKKDAVDGQDAWFKPLVELAFNRVPQVNEDGLIDFRDLGEVFTVEPGDKLMRRIPATEGTSGCDVRGRVIRPKPGKDVWFARGLTGVATAPGDPDVLVADIKGLPVLVENGMIVEQLYTVEQVDMSSGNVVFDGTIQIEGDVLANMKVSATGSIIIGGTVEGGVLEAGGDVQVAGGIIAKSKVTAQGQVSARFVENSTIEAGTVISIEDMVLQSELLALNQIMIGVKSSRRGRLVGGTARTMMLLQAPQIGDDSSGTTTVQVGVNPILEARLQEKHALAAQQEAEHDKLRKAVQHLKAAGDKTNRLELAVAAWKEAGSVWSQTLKEIQELEAQIEMFTDAKVELTQGMEGTVIVLFGKRSCRVQRSLDAGSITLDAESGHIIHTDRRGAPIVLS